MCGGILQFEKKAVKVRVDLKLVFLVFFDCFKVLFFPCLLALAFLRSSFICLPLSLP